MGAIGVNVITVNLSNKDEFFWEGRVGGTSTSKSRACSSENLNLNPKGDQSGCGSIFI